MSASMTRDGEGGKVLRDKGGFLSPVVSLIDHDGRRAVLKDYRRKNAITRNLIAPALVRRESDVLRHLDGVPGIPRLHAVIDDLALVTEYIEGQHPGRFEKLPDETFRRLAATVRAMHDRGVAHLDLRQKKNILIDRDLRPWLIDFANAMIVKPASPLRPMFAKLCAIDDGALTKFKARYWPHLLTDTDREAMKRQRFLRRLWPFSPHTDRAKDMTWQ
jgi:predicted Ser/Thr protein kinase